MHARNIGAAVIGVDFERLVASPLLRPAPPSLPLVDELRKLAELFKEGLLSDDEFASAKAMLLVSHRRPDLF